MTIIASISKIGNIKSISSSSIASGKSTNSFGGNRSTCEGSSLLGANIGANANVGILGSNIGVNANANVGLSGPIVLLIDTTAKLGGSCGCN